MDWEFPRFDPWTRTYSETKKRNIDTEKARSRIKAIHLLAKHGARWMPKDRGEVNSMRRSLLKMKDDYTVEFVWIMSKYQACTRAAINDLLRTSTIRALVVWHTKRINDLLGRLPETLATQE